MATSACRGLVSAGRRCRTPAAVAWPLVQRGLDARCDSSSKPVFTRCCWLIWRHAAQPHLACSPHCCPFLAVRTCGVGCSMWLLCRLVHLPRPLAHHQTVDTVCCLFGGTTLFLCLELGRPPDNLLLRFFFPDKTQACQCKHCCLWMGDDL